MKKYPIHHLHCLSYTDECIACVYVCVPRVCWCLPTDVGRTHQSPAVTDSRQPLDVRNRMEVSSLPEQQWLLPQDPALQHSYNFLILKLMILSTLSDSSILNTTYS